MVWAGLALRRIAIGLITFGVAVFAVADARNGIAVVLALGSLVVGSILGFFRVRQGVLTTSERIAAERRMRVAGGIGGVAWIALAALAVWLDPQSGLDIAGAVCAGVASGFFLVLGLGPLRDTRI